MEILSRKKINQMAIEIKDNGPGISEQHQTHIFERFYCGDTSKKNYNGKGLGLGVAAHIVNLNNEGIEVESNLGNGSTFRIYFLTV